MRFVAKLVGKHGTLIKLHPPAIPFIPALAGKLSRHVLPDVLVRFIPTPVGNTSRIAFLTAPGMGVRPSSLVEVDGCVCLIPVNVRFVIIVVGVY